MAKKKPAKTKRQQIERPKIETRLAGTVAAGKAMTPDDWQWVFNDLEALMTKHSLERVDMGWSRTMLLKQFASQ